MVKNPPANAGDIRDAGSVPDSGRAPAGGRGSPLQCSCLENPTDREAWRATGPGVTESRTYLRDSAPSTLVNKIPRFRVFYPNTPFPQILAIFSR